MSNRRGVNCVRVRASRKSAGRPRTHESCECCTKEICIQGEDGYIEISSWSGGSCGTQYFCNIICVDQFIVRTFNQKVEQAKSMAVVTAAVAKASDSPQLSAEEKKEKLRAALEAAESERVADEKVWVQRRERELLSKKAFTEQQTVSVPKVLEDKGTCSKEESTS